MRRVLMVAYHFPPLAGSSGIQRTLRFVQHLPKFGWQPMVLTVRPEAYERVEDDLTADIPAETLVCRAFAFDAARHLSLAGRYLRATARPDRWVSWKLDAVRRAMKLIRVYQPQVVWSTYPIATAHLIGAELQRRSGLPWIADFRDPMAQEGYPADPLTRRRFLEIEWQAMDRAALSMFTTPGAAAMYRQRYPQAAERIAVLENGYDEESFVDAETRLADRSPLNPGALTLLHSGIVYPSERDPTQLFVALRLLQQRRRLAPGQLRLRFRASVHDALLHKLAGEQGVGAYVETLPALPYREALQEMLRADALLVLQASNCNEQIPAKLYEYLRARRPIVCLSDPRGDTVGVLRAAGIESYARLDDAADIANLLARWIEAPPSTAAALDDSQYVREAARERRAAALAASLSRVAERRSFL